MMETSTSSYPRPNQVLSLLSARERGCLHHGGNAISYIPKQRRLCSRRHGGDVMQSLASSVPWNARRMQNMILSIGPGTPASNHYSHSFSNSNSEASSSSSSATPSPSHNPSSQQQQAERIQLQQWMRQRLAEDETEERGITRPHPSDSSSEEEEEEEVEERGGVLKCKSGYVPSMRHGGCINTATWLDCPWRLSTASLCITNSYNANSSPFLEKEDTTKAVPNHWKEVPTQLLTSGDDRIIKFWDVSLSMGTTSPIAGGLDTLTPFSSSTPNAILPMEQIGSQVPGLVKPLLSLHTDHHGNVFHITPIPSDKGKIISCAADGFVRLADVEIHALSSSSSSFPNRRSTSHTPTSIIISPEYDDTSGSSSLSPLLRPGMCFSHVLLNSHVGLVCSERGLRKFDVRLPPREQQRWSCLMTGEGGRRNGGGGGEVQTCKACAVWKGGGNGGEGEENLESSYVFAGGSSADVALYDLRMSSSSSSPSRIVQRYRPQHLNGSNNSSVSVSGIDVSKDQRELLVSYENDQIYTFPIFPKSSSPAGPTLEELSTYSNLYHSNGAASDSNENDDDDNDDSRKSNMILPELAAYGGHLNRYTFLKMAKYAGPNDEYICTGSDSGHAWIYERSTGAVVSLLKADNSTCNGVVPHPSLPFFITYGIDSTAKLWRATLPVDERVDDSYLGRHKASHGMPYEKSPIIHQWRGVQTKLSTLGDFEDSSLSVFPDDIPSRDDDIDDSVFGGLAGVLFQSSRFGMHVPGGPRNDLAKLPQVLRQNYYACARSLINGDDEPVRSGLDGLKRRISLIRLRHQADKLGLVWDPSNPWMMRPKEHLQCSEKEKDVIESEEETENESKEKIRFNATKYGNHADLIPDFPGDWIPYDPDMTSKPKPCGIDFNKYEYGDFLGERYGSHLVQSHEEAEKENVVEKDDDSSKANDAIKEAEHPANPSAFNGDKDKMKGDDDTSNNSTSEVGAKVENLEVSSQKEDSMDIVSTPLHNGDIEEEEDDDSSREADFTSPAWEVLLESVLLLKESGNDALQAGAINLAARRYDKAIQYCAVAYTEFPVGDVTFLVSHQDEMMKNSGHEIHWTALLKALITIRLNLSMTMLKKQINDPPAALEQAQLALNELKPFTSTKWRLDKAQEDEINQQTYKEAKELQAKAYFRLGTAQTSSGDFAAAIRSFEHSMRSTREATPGREPEPVVLRRLADAKREHLRKKKRHRKKFKFMFSNEEGGGTNGASGTEGKEG